MREVLRPQKNRTTGLQSVIIIQQFSGVLLDCARLNFTGTRKHQEGSSDEKASNPSKRHGGLCLRSLDSSLIFCLQQRGRSDGTRAFALGVDSPLVVEQPSEGVDLSEPHAQHDQHVDTGPEGDPPQVVLQQVSVASLERPQDRLHLTTALQPPVNRLHRLLPQKR